MAGVVQLKRQLLDYTTSLYNEAILDGQFTQLQQLQDESNPDFVVEVVSLFFEDSQRLLNDLTATLNQQIVDFKRVDAHVHQLKGSSSSTKSSEGMHHLPQLLRSTEYRRVFEMLTTGEVRVLFGEEQA